MKRNVIEYDIYTIEKLIEPLTPQPKLFACTKCERVLPVTEFFNRKDSPHGHHNQCKSCMGKKRKAYYKKHPEKWVKYREDNIEHITKRKREHRQKRRLRVLTHYGGSPPVCACCGEGHIEFLTIDHINNDGAEHRREIGGSRALPKWIEDNDFPEGFRVLCYNCNCAEGHYGYCPHNN